MKLFEGSVLTSKGKEVAAEVEATMKPMITGLVKNGASLAELTYLITSRANYLAAFACLHRDSIKTEAEK